MDLSEGILKERQLLGTGSPVRATTLEVTATGDPATSKEERFSLGI